MDYHHEKRLLEILVGNVARILREGFGVNSAESALFSVVDLLRTGSPELKEHFLGLADATLAISDPGSLEEGIVPIELLELVVHELKWRELQGLAEKRVIEKFGGDLSRALGDVSRRIFDASSTDWLDREFYARYQSDAD